MPKLERNSFRSGGLPKQRPYNTPVLEGEHLVRMGVKMLNRRIEYLKGCLSNMEKRRTCLGHKNLRKVNDEIKEIHTQIAEAEREMGEKLQDELEKELGFRCETDTNKVRV